MKPQPQETQSPCLLYSFPKKQNTVRFNNKAPQVEIDTPHLHIQSIQAEDAPTMMQWFGCSETMEKFGEGECFSIEVTTQAAEGIAKRWQQTPLGSFKVSLHNQEPIGQIGLTDYEPGIAELYYIFKKYGQNDKNLLWGQGYGKEAAQAVVNDYLPQVKTSASVKGVPLNSLMATARTDNLASNKILTGLGMQWDKTEVKFGHERHFYAKML